MKSINLFLVTLLTIFFIGCENEPVDSALNSQVNNPNNNNPTSGVFKATFDGQVFQTSTVECVLQNGILLMNAARTPNNDSFEFVITNAAVGTFPAKDHGVIYEPANSGGYGYWAANINNPNEDLGSVVITSIDMVNKKISGTFNFKGYWSDTDNTSIIPVQFTNGVFQNVPYITQEETGDTFAAKVNNTDFLDVNILTITTDINGQEFISVGAQDTDLNSITVSVKSDLAVGNYNITGNTTTDVVQAIYDFDDENYVATSGNVNITTKTATRIKGTFSFISGTFSVTQGSFDVEY